MHSKKFLFRLTLAIACYAVSAAPGLAQEVKGVSDKEIRIGTMTALTGVLAQEGASFQAGTGAAISAFNDRGGLNGRKIKLIGEDNAYSAPQALAVTRKMVSSEGGIFAMLGSHATPQTAAVLPYLLDQQKVPVFGAFGGLKEWFNPPREGLFATYPLGEDQALVLGRWAAKDGHKKIMTLHIDGALYQSQARDMERGVRATSKDATVELVPIKFATADYAPVVIRIAQARPDALVVMLNAPEVILLAKELQNQRLQIPIYGWYPVVSQNLLTIGGSAVEGLKAVSATVSPLDDTPAVKEYRDNLKKYFPAEKPDSWSLYSYAATKVFLEALTRVKGPLTQQEFSKAIYTLKGFDGGLLPPMTFAPNRHQGSTSVFQAQVVNGKWKVGAPVDAANPNW